MSSPRFKNNKWSEGKLNILVLNIITLVSENFKVFCFNSQWETLFIHIKNEVTKFKTSGMIVATKVQKRYELHGRLFTRGWLKYTVRIVALSDTS